MLHIDEYLSNHPNLSRATLYRKLEAGKLLSILKNGKTYIIEPDKLKDYPPKVINEITRQVEGQLDKMIIRAAANKDNRAGNLKYIEKLSECYKAEGLQLKKGYGLKTLYRKINDLNQLNRKSRCDNRFYRQPLVNKMLHSHILPLAAHIYFTNAKPNIYNTTHLLRDFAKTREDLYEVAAIPSPSLYRVLKREFAGLGMKEKHQLHNHFNKWFVKKAYNTGAFTDDINFMDYILGDDNKRNIASAWVYNNHTRRCELKQIKSWHWIEAKTGKVLSYINKTTDLNADDLILTLIEALQKVGIPRKGIIIDNGIGSSEDIDNFITQLNYALLLKDKNAHTLKVKFSKPYHPTDKAPIERSFGWTKDEFDSQFPNFVGDNHKEEGIHRTNSLTPEQAEYSFDEYARKFRDYIFGWYETKERERVSNGKKQTISIREMWEQMSLNYEQVAIPHRALRFALFKKRSFVYKGGGFRFSLAGYYSDYIPITDFDVLPASFAHRQFNIYYNPMDPTEVDLYTVEPIVDKIYGLFYDRGQFVCTLKAVRSMGSEKQQKVAYYNSQLQKHIRHLAINMVDADVRAEIDQHNKLIDTPKDVSKEIVQIFKNEMPLEKVAAEASKRVKKRNEPVDVNEIGQPVYMTLDEINQINNNQ